MPTAMAATAGRVDSKVDIAGCFSPVFWPSRALASLASSFSLPPSRQEPGTRTSSSTTSAVCEARMPCFLYFWPCERPVRARRHDEAGLAPALELRVDGRHHDVDVGDAAVGDPRLGAVEHPLVLGLVVDGPGAQRAARRSRRRARTRSRRRASRRRRRRSTAAPTRRSARACRVPAMPAAASPEPKIDSAMPASPQKSSSIVTGSVRPVGSPIMALAMKSIP